jgi:3-deoxy-D-manno-octulosonate 8-phosphate phosphatase (KDO 8-P phosphatase)
MSIADSRKPNANGRWPTTDSPTALSERCANIQMLVIDVDGVLTDGSIVYSEEGVELKAFHVRDGTGLKIWQQQGRRAALVTGRTSRAVEIRATELGIDTVVQGAVDKLQACRCLLGDSGLRFEQVCAIGDDLPDLPVLCNCGLAVAVADACSEVRSAAHYVTRAPGGRGAVREVIELILRCQGHWQPVVEQFKTKNERTLFDF